MLGKEPQEKLDIKLCPDGSGQLYVPGLTEFQVQSVEDINKVITSWQMGKSGGKGQRKYLVDGVNQLGITYWDGVN